MGRGGLHEILDAVTPLHERVLHPVARNKTYEQLHLGAEFYAPETPKALHASQYYGRQYIVGQQFELRNSQLFGGKVINNTYVNYDGTPRQLRPDIIDIRRRQAREVKAAQAGKDVMIAEAQIIGNQLLQREEPFKKFTINFDIYRYEMNAEGSPGATLYAVRFPLSVAEKLLEISGNYGYVTDRLSRRQIVIRRAGMNEIFQHPEASLKALGLDPSRFTYDRYMTARFTDWNNDKVDKHPLLMIIDKDYDRWRVHHRRTFDPYNIPARMMPEVRGGLFAPDVYAIAERDAIEGRGRRYHSRKNSEVPF